MPPPGLARRVTAEAVGTAFLVAAVVGSGIAAQRLSPDDVGLQLLENSLATGAALVALILAFGSLSGPLQPRGHPRRPVARWHAQRRGRGLRRRPDHRCLHR